MLATMLAFSFWSFWSLSSYAALAIDEVAPGADDRPQVREPGVSYRVYDIGERIEKLWPLVPGQTPNASRVISRVSLRDEEFGLEDQFVAVLDGFLKIDEPGAYVLRLVSDDGSRLTLTIADEPDELGAEVVLENDGLHGAVGVNAPVDLPVGEYPFVIEYFENQGDAALQLQWKTPGSEAFEVVPTSALSCRKGEVRVTSPGTKLLLRPSDRRRPGDGLPLDGVHPSFDLSSARPDSFKPKVGGMDFLSDGRLVVSTWDDIGAVYLLDGVDGDDPEAISVKRIAEGLAEPLGLNVVDDKIYVLQKQELTLLVDRTRDDVIDEYKCLCAGWPVTANFHEFAFGLTHDPESGAFYANLATAIDPGGRSTDPQIEGRGSVIRILQDGSFEYVAQGLRTPNGIGYGAYGDIYICDNQGDWLPVSKLLVLEDGAYYGNRSVLKQKADGLEDMPPVAWLPQGEIGNSPSEPAPLDVGPFRSDEGQMIHGEVTHGGIKRVFVDQIGGADGVQQGAVFRFTQGLEAGINRMVWGPDGALYVGGIGSTGNWQQEGKLWSGLQRLRFNGVPAFEMLAVRVMSNGLEIEFTEPLNDDGQLEDVRGFLVEDWRYVPTVKYGGPKVDKRKLTVKSASASADRRRVFLEIDGMEEDRVVYLRLMGLPLSEAGRTLWSTESWVTVNRIPGDGAADRVGVVATDPLPRSQNVLDDHEREQHFVSLFDGETLNGWRGFNAEGAPANWSVVDEAIVCAGGGGDLVSQETFDDFEFAFDWKVEPGSNSGVFFHVTEDNDQVWDTGPEYQILDNALHDNGMNPLTSAAANYALHAPAFDVTRPVGMWNSGRIVVRNVNGDGHVEHWLNGFKVVEYELGSDDWTHRVAASKFATMPKYGKTTSGHLALQDHGDPVAYRNLRVRRL